MTLKQLEAFRAIMLAGSITGAAKMLFVSQPAVSRILSDLEESVGFKLFARVNRIMVATEEGNALYSEVERAFTGLDELKSAAKSIRLCRHGQLRIIITPGIGSNLIAGMVKQFNKENPGVGVSIEVQASQRFFEWVISQRCDIGISTLPAENPAIQVQRFARGKALCMLPKGHPLSAKKSVSAEDLEGERFISFRLDSVARSLIDAAFIKANVSRELHIEARTTDMVAALVQAGMGVSVINPTFDANHMNHNVIVKPFSPTLYTEFGFLFPASKPPSIVATKFVEAANKYLANHLANEKSSMEAIH